MIKINEHIKHIGDSFRNIIDALKWTFGAFVAVGGGLMFIFKLSLDNSIFYTSRLFGGILIFVLIVYIIKLIYKKVLKWIIKTINKLRIFRRLKLLEKENYELRSLLRQLNNPKDELKDYKEYNKHLQELLCLYHEYGSLNEKIKKEEKHKKDR